MLCTLCLKQLVDMDCTSESQKVSAKVEDINTYNAIKHLQNHSELEEVATFLKPIDDKKRKKTDKCSDTEQTKLKFSKVAPMGFKWQLLPIQNDFASA